MLCYNKYLHCIVVNLAVLGTINESFRPRPRLPFATNDKHSSGIYQSYEPNEIPHKSSGRIARFLPNAEWYTGSHFRPAGRRYVRRYKQGMGHFVTNAQ